MEVHPSIHEILIINFINEGSSIHSWMIFGFMNDVPWICAFMKSRWILMDKKTLINISCMKLISF
jgi:hypothetical protein